MPLVLGSAQANAAILDDDTCPTLTAQMGTRGNNMPLVLTQNQVGEIRCSETIAPTLTGQANASARNHPLVLMDQGGGVMSIEHDKVGTLRAQTHGHEPLVLSESGGALPHVFKLRSGCDGGGKGYLGQDDKSFTLATNNDQYVMTKEPIPINTQVVQGRPSDNGRMGSGIGKPGDPANTLQANHSHGVFDMQARVRKLTPIECERLQGFSDNYTRIPWKGKSAEECPDSPRYKAIGNSWCIPCVRWIGKRIEEELKCQQKLK